MLTVELSTIWPTKLSCKLIKCHIVASCLVIIESFNQCFNSDHVTVGGEDRKIPLLKEVFENFPQVPVNIDIKVDNDELIRKVSIRTSILLLSIIALMFYLTICLRNKIFM